MKISNLVKIMGLLNNKVCLVQVNDFQKVPFVYTNYKKKIDKSSYMTILCTQERSENLESNLSCSQFFQKKRLKLTILSIFAKKKFRIVTFVNFLEEFKTPYFFSRFTDLYCAEIFFVKVYDKSVNKSDFRKN